MNPPPLPDSLKDYLASLRPTFEEQGVWSIGLIVVRDDPGTYEENLKALHKVNLEIARLQEAIYKQKGLTREQEKWVRDTLQRVKQLRAQCAEELAKTEGD